MHLGIAAAAGVSLLAAWQELMAPPRYDLIELVMNISGSDFTFNYRDGSNDANPKDMATTFCEEKGMELGFSLEEMDQCVDPLSLQLERVMRRQSQNLKKCKEKHFEKGVKMSFTELDLEECIDPLSKELENVMRRQSHITHKGGENTDTVTKKIPSNGSYGVRVKSNFGNLEEAVDDGAEPVDVTKNVLSPEGVRRLPFEINGVTYDFEYHIDLEIDFISASLAREFCVRKGTELGIYQAGDEGGRLNMCELPLMEAMRAELLSKQGT